MVSNLNWDSVTPYLQTLIISLLPTLVLPLLPSTNRVFLTCCKSFGAGGLIADVFLCSLPESFEREAGGTGHDVIGKGVGLGISVFFFLDLFGRDGAQVPDGQQRGLLEEGAIVEGVASKHKGLKFRVVGIDRGWVKCKVCDGDGDELNFREKDLRLSSNGEGMNGVADQKSGFCLKRLSPTAKLNLLGDALHNFTDGLFLSLTPDTKFMSTLGVAMHEIPHELGDYAVLVEEGFTKSEAIGMQVSLRATAA